VEEELFGFRMGELLEKLIGDGEWVERGKEGRENDVKGAKGGRMEKI
jgi:hypothetical protein